MLSATVENRSKRADLWDRYGGGALISAAQVMYEQQGALQETLDILRGVVHELGNRHVIRLLEGYFFEMALVIAELGRIVRPGGTVVHGQRQCALSRRRSASRPDPERLRRTRRIYM